MVLYDFFNLGFDWKRKIFVFEYYLIYTKSLISFHISYLFHGLIDDDFVHF